MSKAPQIREQIKSIKKTKTITRAMQMVATSKMRKARSNMVAIRPYADKAREIIAHLAQINPAQRESYSLLRTSQQHDTRIGVILITADKGLCGALNSNLIKKFIDLKNANLDAELLISCVGQKALNFATNAGLNIKAEVVDIGLTPNINKIIAATHAFFQEFKDKKLDKVFVIYSKFVNTMKQVPTCEQLFPLTDRDLKIEKKYSWDYLYEPSTELVLNNLVMRYIEFIVYQCITDTIASEQAARMMAMQAATDNANVLINDLNLAYNKSRQATITQELAEIVSGAANV
jgi:F-type H+-transporting ATPase subunit gamma